jgi:hypothetical protein
MIPITYTSLALSFRQWHYRMTTRQWDLYGPTWAFAAMQWINLFSILLPLAHFLPTWLLMSILLVGSIVTFMLTSRIYRSNPITPDYASGLKDSVPGIRAFPLIYSYLLFTFALFIGSILLTVNTAT